MGWLDPSVYIQKGGAKDEKVRYVEVKQGKIS